MNQALKAVRATILVLVATFVTGCIDQDMTLTVKDDGTATLQVATAYDASKLDGFTGVQNDRAKPSNRGSFCAVDTNEPTQDGLTRDVKSYTRNGDQVCSVTVSGPIEKIAEVIASMSATMAEVTTSVGVKDPASIALVNEGSGRYRLSFHIPDHPAVDGLPGASVIDELVERLFTNRSITLKVVAPKILETNGKLSEDGTTTSISMPLAKLLTGGAVDNKFDVLLQDHQPGFLARFRSWLDR